MKMIEEFKKFAIKGNVIDLAVAVVIGAAFGKIVSSFVDGIIMPLVGVLVGGVNFSSLSIPLKGDSALMYGSFIQAIIDFLIIAWCIFIAVKMINKIKEKPAEEEKPAEPSEDILLLREIRDELKKN